MLTARWEPIAEVSRLSREMDRMFGSFDLGASHRTAFRAYPPVNVWQDEDHFFVESELPGCNLEDLDVTVRGAQLTIKGKRMPPQLEHGRWLRQERGYYEFNRSLELPAEVDAESVSASLNNGVLTITLNKRAEVKPRRIEVRAV